MRKYKTVIFVDGCFWHGHEGCRYFRLPKSNVEFWQRKIERNKARDTKNEAELEAMGWRVLRVWECDVRPVAGRKEYLDALYERIVMGFELERQDEWISGQEEQEQRMFGQEEQDDWISGQEEQEYREDMDIAAEPEVPYGVKS